MKRLFVIVLALCLLFVGVMTWTGLKNKGAQSAAPAVTDTPPGDAQAPDEQPEPVAPEEDAGLTADEPAERPEVLVLDKEALLDLHDADEVIATVNGREITWGLYAYWLIGNAASVENYMLTMSYYGQATDWNAPWNGESGESYLDYLTSATEEYVKQVAAIEATEDDGVVLSEETEAEIAQALEDDRIASCGEDATDEDYRAYLRANAMTPEVYERLMRMSYLYQEGFKQLYGENREKLSDEETLAYLEEQGYLAANHILVTEQEDARAIAAELQAIEDRDELLERFAALKEEKDEDPGKVSYPNGYVFTAGEMAAQFESAARALELYGVSEPVMSDYGYHVILRLPLDPDAVIDYSQSGEGLTARSIAARTLFNERLDEWVQSAQVEYADGFEKPDLAALLIPAE